MVIIYSSTFSSQVKMAFYQDIFVVQQSWFLLKKQNSFYSHFNSYIYTVL